MATMSVNSKDQNSTNHIPTTKVTPDNNTVLAEIFIAAPPDRVFQALTDPVRMPQWWGSKGMYRITECAGDVRPGGKWHTVGVGNDGTAFRIDGEYLEIDRPRLLVYTWLATFAGMLKTTVRFDLELRDVHGLQHQGPQRVGTGTFLKVRHDGFAGNVEAAKAHSEGWLRVLGWLQGFVEKGQTLENRE
jgi:uncharacterized protein YndB with AHSA1/START domain